ncbi:hypothetical protein BDR05DRAFT_961189 [Suillus weaverae]|nr:hypothetical protein BDR05DRAFT_961189 [Suillus weaverae]
MLPEKKVPAVGPQFVDADTMARDNHINIVSMTQSTSGSASSLLPQAQSLSVGQKRVAEDLEERDAKRIQMGSGGIKNDQYLKPVLYQYGQCDGTYVCYKDGSVLRPGSHIYHTKTAEYLGIRDTDLVASVLLPSQVREITLAEVQGDVDFWRWINDLEDFLPSSQVREITLAEVHGDLDVWRLINEIEDFADPELPLCESPTDAAEDPDFCNFPLRTLLICSWLDNSYGSASP